MRPIVFTVGPLAAANATNIRTAAIIAAGTLTLDGTLVTGGVAILDTARRVLFTFAGDGSGLTLTLTGTNWAGDIISETLAGANANTTYSVLSYKTLVSVVSSATLASNVSIGTNQIADSPWIRLDEWALPNLTVQCVVSGTINYTVQQTLDDPNSPTNPVAVASITWSDSVAATAATATTTLANPLLWVRVRVNTMTNPGAVTTTAIQTGVMPF